MWASLVCASVFVCVCIPVPFSVAEPYIYGEDPRRSRRSCKPFASHYKDDLDIARNTEVVSVGFRSVKPLKKRILRLTNKRAPWPHGCWRCRRLRRWNRTSSFSAPRPADFRRVQKRQRALCALFRRALCACATRWRMECGRCRSGRCELVCVDARRRTTRPVDPSASNRHPPWVCAAPKSSGPFRWRALRDGITSACLRLAGASPVILLFVGREAAVTASLV